MAGSHVLKDPARSFSPMGRPMRKPKRAIMRLASLSSTPRGDLEDYLILERPTKTWKYMSLQERLESRPPIVGCLDGPTPCTYSVRSAQQWTVGGVKINPKTKYQRDALPYPNTEIWTHNVSVFGKSPGPTSYKAPNVFGKHCPTKQEAPSFTMASRKVTPLTRKGAENEPGPSSYFSAESLESTLPHHPAFTIAARNEHKRSTSTPGPAHYHPKYTITQFKGPSFSFRQRTSTL